MSTKQSTKSIRAIQPHPPKTIGTSSSSTRQGPIAQYILHVNVIVIRIVYVAASSARVKTTTPEVIPERSPRENGTVWGSPRELEL